MKLQNVKGIVVSLVVATLLGGLGVEPSIFGQEKVLAAQNIPSAAQKFGENYYMVFNERESWTDAKEKCEKMGGHLATITSKKENEFVYNLVEKADGGNAWIGLYNVGDSKNENWKWVTGEKVLYENWKSGEPSFYSYGNIESYVGFFNGIEWNDFVDESGEVDSYVCEWEKYSISVSDTVIKLYEGEATTVDAIVKKYQESTNDVKISYSSNKKSVAKVSSKGKIVAQSAGCCTITLKVKNVQKKIKVIVLPGKVTGIKKVSATKNSIKLSWKSQKGVSGYEVWKYDSDLEEYEKVKSVSGDFSSATINDLKKNTKYEFKIRAYVKDGSKKYYGENSKKIIISTSK